jgi:anti-sigma regulatory factor (Ser/Thr protein kinase)
VPSTTDTRTSELAGTGLTLRVDVVALTDLRALRRSLADLMERAGFDPTRRADAQLVVSELATNAIEHDAPPVVDVDLACSPSRLVVELRHAGTGADRPWPASLPPEGSIGGRGLAIVDQIVGDRRVEREGSFARTTVVVAAVEPAA